MKKVVLVLAILLLAAPAMAEVKITCSQNADVITVTYNATSEVNLPRGFALDITLTDTAGADNAVITEVTAAKVGESNNSSRGFGIFLGSGGVDINDDGEINSPPQGRGWGSPAANPGDPCALTGVGTNAVTVELASLYKGPQGVGNPNAPPKNGNLLTFKVNKKVCAVTVALNSRRGGIVMEDPDEVVDANLPGVGTTAAFQITCPGDICGLFYGAPDHIANSWDYNLITNINQWLIAVPPADARADICGLFYGPKDNVVNSWDLNYVTNSGRWMIDWK